MSFGSGQETYRPFGETLGISGKAVQDSFEGGGGEEPQERSPSDCGDQSEAEKRRMADES